MKLIFILLVLAVIGQSLQRNSTSECLAKNPFIRVMSRLNVTIYPKPTPDLENHCPGEWSQFNTCCEPSSLKKYSEKYAEHIRESVSDVNKEISVFQRFVERFNSTIYELAALSDIDWKSSPLVSQNKTFKTQLAALLQEVNKKTIYKDFFDFRRSDITEFRESNIKCWDKMIQLRNSALCSTCSGRSEVFFSKLKANMQQNQCRSIIQDCWITFKYASKYFVSLAELNFIKELNQRVDGGFLEIQGIHQINVTKVEQFVMKMGNEDIKYRSLHRYFQNDTKLSEDQVKQRRLLARILCKRFMRISGYPWIMYLDKSFLRQKPLNATLKPNIQALIDEAKSKIGSSEFQKIIDKKGAEVREFINQELIKSEKETPDFSALKIMDKSSEDSSLSEENKRGSRRLFLSSKSMSRSLEDSPFDMKNSESLKNKEKKEDDGKMQDNQRGGSKEEKKDKNEGCKKKDNKDENKNKRKEKDEENKRKDKDEENKRKGKDEGNKKKDKSEDPKVESKPNTDHVSFDIGDSAAIGPPAPVQFESDVTIWIGVLVDKPNQEIEGSMYSLSTCSAPMNLTLAFP